MRKALILVLLLCFTLTACQKEEDPVSDIPAPPLVPETQLPSAEDLVANGSLGEIDSLDANVTLHFEAKMSAEALSSGLPVSGNGGLMLNMGVDMDINLKSQGNVQYINGTMGADVLGFSYEEPVEQYLVTNADGSVTTYEKDATTSSWSYKTEAASSIADIENFASLDTSFIHDLSLSPVYEGDPKYTVTGTISLADFPSQTGMDGLLDATGGSAIPEDMVFDLAVSYDMETSRMTGMILDLDTSSLATEDVAVKSFLMSIDINSVDSVAVSVPQEVLDTALEKMDWSKTDWDASGWNN